jgi:hypothetical protein
MEMDKQQCLPKGLGDACSNGFGLSSGEHGHTLCKIFHGWP